MAEAAEKLSPLQREILKRWQKKMSTVVTQSVKDELSIRFDGEAQFNEPMALHSTMKVGGPAEVFLKPRSREAIVFAVRLAEEHGIPVYFHGGGSNTLVRDQGIRGFVISTFGILKTCTVVEQTADHIDIFCESGASFPQLLAMALAHGAADLAPLVGIPGSIGGAILMNAGTPQREIKDVVRSVTVLTKEGLEETISREKLIFNYRSLQLPRTHCVLSALFRLQDLMAVEDVKNLYRQFQQKRMEKQPLTQPSLGCIFKNPAPEGKKKFASSAGQLIDEAGLKNVRVGGARVSPVHANFIVNEGGANAKDILSLISLIKDRVKQTSGVVLETEIKIIGEG
jgi:UDP-N-acetylmuramate dehydrogenase